MTTHRVLALVSGGLDSALAARVAQEQGLDVVPVHFVHPWGCGGAESRELIRRQLSVEPRVVEAGADFVRVIREPRFGRGRNFNPCLDCRVFMFETLKPLLMETGSEAIVTGEVVGQRPMSQTRKHLVFVENEAGLSGRILRPLSAKLLPATALEGAGVIDREDLFGFAGRSRAPQLELARRLGIAEFQAPAGGCHLTNRSFIPKLQDFFRYFPDEAIEDARLLSIGRHFRISPALKLILARNELEGLQLEAWGGSPGASAIQRTAFSPDGFDGPSALACGELSEEDEELAGGLILRYSRHQHAPSPEGYPLRVISGGSERRIMAKTPLDTEVAQRFLIAPASVSASASRPDQRRDQSSP